MDKKTYNCKVDSLNVQDDGKTLVLPPEAQEHSIQNSKE